MTSGDPQVSIVIPVHGKWAYTRKCLASIKKYSSEIPFEVIVVDDCSPDDSARLAEASRGVRLVRTPTNLGFIGACNTGANAARGQFLVFLNNDTQVKRGWLDALVATAAADPKIGLVGAKLIWPDGRLQECGGIIWSDGTGYNYGRGGNAKDPRFNVMRDVDYCSGAAILVRSEVFEKVGGFDPRYAPAYYEDTDLAFAIRASGFRTVVQPKAVVVHHEGISHGTDVSSGTKRFQEINRPKFVEKWAEQLALHKPRATTTNVWAGRHRSGHGHTGGLVIVLDSQLPRPDMDGGSVRMVALLDELVGLGQRVLFLPADGRITKRYAEPLQQRGITVFAEPHHFDGLVRELAPELRLAILSRPNVAWRLLADLRACAPQCIIAYDTVDLHFLRQEREADLAEQLGQTEKAVAVRRQAASTRALELGLMQAADLTFVVSEAEQQLLAEVVPDVDVRILSNVHHVSRTPATLGQRAGVIFVGSFAHPPNCDAAEWLVNEIMPLVRAKNSDAELHIVGSNAPEQIKALAGPGVIVHGWVEALEPLYERMRIAIAPMRYGAGVKGKVGESAGLGVPTVGTAIALEGMRLTHDQDVLAGETPEQLADAVLALLEDDDLWQRISTNGKAAVARQFGPEPVRVLLGSLLEESPDSGPAAER